MSSQAVVQSAAAALCVDAPVRAQPVMLLSSMHQMLAPVHGSQQLLAMLHTLGSVSGELPGGQWPGGSWWTAC